MDALINFFVGLVTLLFFLGLVGSALVVVISFVEDMSELFGE